MFLTINGIEVEPKCEGTVFDAYINWCLSNFLKSYTNLLVPYRILYCTFSQHCKCAINFEEKSDSYARRDIWARYGSVQGFLEQGNEPQ